MSFAPNLKYYLVVPHGGTPFITTEKHIENGLTRDRSPNPPDVIIRINDMMVMKNRFGDDNCKVGHSGDSNLIVSTAKNLIMRDDAPWRF